MTMKKEFMAPEMEVVQFAEEPIMDSTVNGIIGIGNGQAGADGDFTATGEFL
mgnify:FL=1